MSTRSKRGVKVEKQDDSVASETKKPVFPQKVFFFNEKILKNPKSQLIQKFYHPGKEENTFFVVNEETKTIQEVMAFDETHRCWFIDQNAYSNGNLYMTIPIDPAFLVLHYLKRFCKDKALQLDQIEDQNLPKAPQILNDLVEKKCLEVIADVKNSGGMVFYKYNPKRTLAWLQLKVNRVVAILKKEGIHCGYSSLSANYVKSEKNESAADEEDFVRVAVGIVGQYLDLDLLEDLKKKFGIKDKKPIIEEPEKKTPASKRKSIKLEITSPDGGEYDNDDHASKKIKLEAEKPKEKKISAKEEKLAKAAKGTKSISSFFTKK